MEIKVGDRVTVESDSGSVSNAPWSQRVAEVKDGKVGFNEGGSELVFYHLSPANLLKVENYPCFCPVNGDIMQKHYVFSK